MDTKCIYICIDNYWFDLTNYKHPGGQKILQKFHLKDGTQAFNEIPGHVEAYRLLENFEIKDKILLEKLNHIQFRSVGSL
jgi:cytochrome b involved in lipid metabolism